MAKWLHKVKIRHLMTEKEDHASVQQSMDAIADVLDKHSAFFSVRQLIKRFRAIPQGDEFFGPVDYANKLLNEMWDYCDRERIWIEL